MARRKKGEEKEKKKMRVTQGAGRVEQTRGGTVVLWLFSKRNVI